MRKKKKFKSDDLFRIYVSILVMWTALSLFMPMEWLETKILFLIFLVTFASLSIIILMIFFSIIDENAKNTPKMFFKLATLPLLVIVTFFALLISQKEFSEGMIWLFFYTILFMGIAISILLYFIGWFIENFLE